MNFLGEEMNHGKDPSAMDRMQIVDRLIKARQEIIDLRKELDEAYGRMNEVMNESYNRGFQDGRIAMCRGKE